MNFTVSEIVALCGGQLRIGDPNFCIKGFSALAEAGSDDLSFLGNEAYLKDYLASQAGAVFVTKEAPEGRAGATLIEVENPSLAFSLVLEAEHGQRTFEASVHPSAYVDESAEVEGAMIRANAVVEAGVKIGKGTEVGPGVVIERDAVVGEDCLLYANAVVRERCILKDRVNLQPGVVIGSEGYGYEQVDGYHRAIPQVGIVVLEDDVDVGANTTIDRARFGKTHIGRGTKIDNLVQIGHNVVVGEHCLIVAQTGVAGSCKIGNYVTIAAQAGIAGHIEIGDHITFAARTAVVKSMPNAGVYWGVPAVPIKEEKRRIVGTRLLPNMRKELKALRQELDELKEEQS